MDKSELPKIIRRKKIISLNQIVSSEMEKIISKNEVYKGNDIETLEIIKNRWNTIIGGMLTKVTQPIKVKQGKLLIRVNSPAWKNELSFQKNEILGRIEEELGSKIVRDISFVN